MAKSKSVFGSDSVKEAESTNKHSIPITWNVICMLAAVVIGLFIASQTYNYFYRGNLIDVGFTYAFIIILTYVILYAVATLYLQNKNQQH